MRGSLLWAFPEIFTEDAPDEGGGTIFSRVTAGSGVLTGVPPVIRTVDSVCPGDVITTVRINATPDENKWGFIGGLI